MQHKKSRWVKDISKRAKIIELFEEIIGGNHDFGFDNGFLDMLSKAQRKN
jgi:hypothetical protein